MRNVDVRLLGGFAVVVDSQPVPPDAWPHRRALDLVKLLALAPGHRRGRDEVVEALWPHLTADAGAANLHKAASNARRALGDRRAVVLRDGVVELAPDARVSTDVERFEAGDPSAYRGELLPDDRYEGWTADARERLRARRIELLAADERWDELLAEEPGHERANRELARAAAGAGDRSGAVRRLARLLELLAETGIPPSPETVALQAELARGEPVLAPRYIDTPLAGREAELAAALEALGRADEGAGGGLLVTGEAGMGKSRFIEALLADAQRRGFHTLRGEAQAGEAGIPYGPLVEALDPLAAERPDLAAALSDSARAALALVLPSLSGGLGAAPEPASRQRMLSAVGRLLARAADERGVLLVLDDLHAADEATVGIVHYLARSARRQRLLVVAGVRLEESSAVLERLRTSLVEQRAGREIALAPLARGAVRDVVARAAGRPVPDRAVRAIERAAAGNPLFVEELAAGVDAAGEVTLPERLGQLLDARLDRVEPRLTGELEAVLAVIEDGFSAVELAALAGTEPAELEGALGAARRAGVLQLTSAGYRFRHPLVREALIARVPGPRLQRAHREAAERLRLADAPPEQVAHHLLRAGRPGEAVPLLRRAAEWAASVAAFADGAHWVEQALEHAPEAERPALLALHAELLDGTGDPRTLAAYSEAIAAADDDALELRLKKAWAALAAGDLPETAATLEGLAPQEPGQRGRAALVRALVAWFEGDIDACREQAERAEPLLEQGGSSADLAQLDDIRAMVAHHEGDWESHARWRLRETAPEPELAGRVFDAYLCVTEYVLYSGEPYSQLAGFAKRLGARARQTGARRGEAFAATVLGETELLAGNPGGARGHLFEGARLSREVGATGGEAIARLRLGETLLHLGDRQGAAAQLDEAFELAQASTLARHLLYLVQAVMIQVPDDPAEALQLVERADALLPQRRMCAYCPLGYHLAAAGAAARAGEPALARRHLGEAETAVELFPPGPWSAALAEARGELLLAEGERERAGSALRRAVEGFAAAGQHLHEARARARLAAAG